MSYFLLDGGRGVLDRDSQNICFLMLGPNEGVALEYEKKLEIKLTQVTMDFELFRNCTKINRIFPLFNEH